MHCYRVLTLCQATRTSKGFTFKRQRRSGGAIIEEMNRLEEYLKDLAKQGGIYLEGQTEKILASALYLPLPVSPADIY
jgi:hypothetical protein